MYKRTLPEVYGKRFGISGSDGTGTSLHPLPRLFAGILPSRFNIEVKLSKRYQRIPVDALKLVEPAEIKTYFDFRIKSSLSCTRKRQSMVNSYYETLEWSTN